MASISGANTANFQYDPFGRRTSKTIGGASTQFLYDGVNPVQEKDDAMVIARLLTGLAIDEYYTRTDVAWQQNFLTDGLGRTLALAMLLLVALLLPLAGCNQGEAPLLTVTFQVRGTLGNTTVTSANVSLTVQP